jgi:hypothetical protein
MTQTVLPDTPSGPKTYAVFSLCKVSTLYIVNIWWTMWELNPPVRLSATRRLKRMSIAGMVLRRPNIPSVSPNFGAGRGLLPPTLC